MRLLNCDTLKIEVFGQEVPEYATLSHRWTDEEITYQEFVEGRGQEKSGYAKVINATRKATERWLWVDTCCINKQQNDELTEAINSMYRWYQNSKVCMVYLNDVWVEDVFAQGMGSFRRSEWFKRGWTLQELLAPENVRFFDRDWNYIGSKFNMTLILAEITEINAVALGYYRGSLHDYSVAQRMSWAAGRQTTRVEDQAYCLIGLFNVSMPLIYGEGDRAFIRLQEEIMKEVDDYSIFAWRMLSGQVCGLLAPSASNFQGCGSFTSLQSLYGREPFSMTNRGLSIELYLTPWTASTYLAYLECGTLTTSKDSIEQKPQRVCIFLRGLAENDQYARVETEEGDIISDVHNTYSNNRRPIRKKRLFVRKFIGTEVGWHHDIYGFSFPPDWLSPQYQLQAIKLTGSTAVLPSGLWGIVMTVDLSSDGRGIGLVVLGYDFDSNPICIVQASNVYERSVGSAKGFTSSELMDDSIDWTNYVEGDAYNLYSQNSSRQIWAIKGVRNSEVTMNMLVLPAKDGFVSVDIKKGMSSVGFGIWHVDLHAEHYSYEDSGIPPAHRKLVHSVLTDEELPPSGSIPDPVNPFFVSWQSWR